MTYEEFVNEIKTAAAGCPAEWRRGQSVFNVIEERYHVGHKVRELGADCFYDDSLIEKFIRKAWDFVRKRG